jgi:hypothetical protein
VKPDPAGKRKKGIVPIEPLIKGMSYDVKIKKYKVPNTNEEKSALFF